MGWEKSKGIVREEAKSGFKDRQKEEVNQHRVILSMEVIKGVKTLEEGGSEKIFYQSVRGGGKSKKNGGKCGIYPGGQMGASIQRAKANKTWFKKEITRKSSKRGRGGHL